MAAEDPGTGDTETATVSLDTGSEDSGTSSGDTETITVTSDTGSEDTETTTDSSSLETEDPGTTGNTNTTTDSSISDSTITDDDGSTTPSNSDSDTTDTSSTLTNLETTSDLAFSDMSQGTLPDPQIWRDGVPVSRGGHPAGYQYATIAEAINDALPGDTVMLEDGATFNEQITINKDLNINVLNNGHATLDGTSLSGSIITINPSVTVNISNLTIQNGHATDGGGILNNGVLTVTDSTFTYNTADGDGGAIDSRGILTVNNCTFSENTANIGGAICNEIDVLNGSVSLTWTIENSKFTKNTANEGGAIANFVSTFGWGGSASSSFISTIENSKFTENTATASGGAIFNYVITVGIGGYSTSSFASTIEKSIFTKNTVNEGDGGAIANYVVTFGLYGGSASNSFTSTIEKSTFTKNTANTGGAIYHEVSSFEDDGTASYSFNSDIHFNRIIANSNIDVFSTVGTVNAQYNWWGTNFVGTNPLAAGRVNDLVDADPWLVLTLTGSNFDHGVVIRADLLHDSQGGYHDPTGGHVPDGIPVTFNTNSGVLIPRTAYTKNGVAETIFKARHYGSYTIQATVDDQTIQTTVNILRSSGSTSTLTISPLTITSTDPGNNAIGVPVDVTIIVTYNQPISEGPGYNQIVLKDSNGNIIPIIVTIIDNQLIIKPQPPLKPNTKYTLTIPENAVKNRNGNGTPEPYTLIFTTS